MPDSGPQSHGEGLAVIERDVRELAKQVSEGMGKLDAKLDAISSAGAKLGTAVAVAQSESLAQQRQLDSLAARLDSSERQHAQERWGLLLAILGAAVAIGVALLK